jgi:hypothetical protein
MLFLVSWTGRPGGSPAEMLEANRATLKAFEKWTPAAGEYKAMVSRIDGQGGYALIESDNPAGLLEDAAKFSDTFVFETVPVLDMMEAVPVFNTAMQWRESLQG